MNHQPFLDRLTGILRDLLLDFRDAGRLGKWDRAGRTFRT